MRTFKVQRVYVHKLAQVWTQRCCSLITDVVIWPHNTTHTCHTNSLTDTPTTHPQSRTTRAYTQDSTCACSQACPSVDPTLLLPQHRYCCLATQHNTHMSHELTPTTLPQHTHKAGQPVRTFKVQRVHVHKLAQVWTQRCCSLITDVVVWPHNTTHTCHMNSLTNTPTTHPQSRTSHAYTQDSTCACSQACPNVDPTLLLPHHR